MQWSHALIAVSLVTVGLAGCATPQDGTFPPDAGEQVPWETLDQGQHSAIEQKRTEVYRDAAAFEQAWEAHTADMEDPPPVPQVDFATEMVLAAFQGTSSNTCYGVELANATWDQAQNAVVVQGTWFEPAPDAVCGEAITRPFHIVQTALWSGQVVFQMDTQQRRIEPDSPGPAPTPVAFQPVENASSLQVEQRQELVFRNASTWASFWANHTQHRSDPPEAPAVDFTQRMVVGIFKGQSPDGCHGAEITTVEQAAEGPYIVRGAYFKQASGGCTLAITYPSHVVTVPTTDQPVVFKVHQETRSQNETGGTQTGNQSTADGNDTSEGRAQLPMETLASGSGSSIAERQEVVVRNQSAWEDLWDRHTQGDPYPAQRPQVDFEQKMVLAAFKGQSPNGCHGAEIEGVYQDEGGQGLEAEGAYYKIESQDMACSQQITYPYHIVEVPRDPGPVTWDMRNQTRQG